MKHFCCAGFTQTFLVSSANNCSFEQTYREFTGHNAPLISTDAEMSYGPSHPGYMYNVFDSVNLYIDGGMDASKIVLGMPLYGRGWELVNPAS